MLMKENKKIHLDWETLDKHWSNAYETDYGHFFSDTSVKRMDLGLPTCTITRGRTPIETFS